MATLSDGFKDIFLAGIGAMAITGEKTKDLVDQLISKGELTVDQGKQINTELKHKAQEAKEKAEEKTEGAKEQSDAGAAAEDPSPAEGSAA